MSEFYSAERDSLIIDENSGPRVKAVARAYAELSLEDKKRERQSWHRAWLCALLRDHEERVRGTP